MKFVDLDGRALQDPPSGGFWNWSREKQVRVAASVQSTAAAGNRVFKGTGVSVSGSVISIGGKLGVGPVEGKLSAGVGNISAKADEAGMSATASVVEATAKISTNSTSAGAEVTFAEGKATIGTDGVNTNFDVASGKIQVGSDPHANLDSDGKISAGVKVGPANASLSINFEAARDWFVGTVKTIAEMLSPEIIMKPHKDEDNH